MGFWDSQAVLLHVCSAIHPYKQMEHDIKFFKDKEAVATVMLHLETTKDKYVQVHNQEKKGNRNKGESTLAGSNSLEAANLAYKQSSQAVDAMKLEGAKGFELYRSFL